MYSLQIPTPFDERDQVDTAAPARGARRDGPRVRSSGFVVLGSNGEAVLMDDFEAGPRDRRGARRGAARPARSSSAPGRESTQAAIRASRRAPSMAPDAVLVRTPGFLQDADDDRRVRAALHGGCRRVAGAGAPVQLHRADRREPAAGRGLTRSPTHPNIVGMKESGGDVAQIAGSRGGHADDFSVLAGTTATFYAALCVGAVGGILALACAVPDACARLFRARRATAGTPRRWRCSASWCRSRGCSGQLTACPG